MVSAAAGSKAARRDELLGIVDKLVADFDSLTDGTFTSERYEITAR